MSSLMQLATVLILFAIILFVGILIRTDTTTKFVTYLSSVNNRENRTESSFGDLNRSISRLSDLSDRNSNRIFETTIECVGSTYNQSCLYKNLYYVDSQFIVLTVTGRYLPMFSIRTNAFYLWPTTPNKREFNTSDALQHFVRNIIDPMIIPSVTLHFSQHWHFNIGHALFDGLYPAYVALIRFAPRHLYPFRILGGLDDCQDCWSEDIYSRFGGLGLLKISVLNVMSRGRWFVFDELVMGSGTLCQRCTQPDLQLPAGVSLDASRLFRDRMYAQHGIIPSLYRRNHSAEGRTSRDTLSAYIVDNKRYTENDRKQINLAIEELNNYTNMNTNRSHLEWPLIRATFLYYNKIKTVNRTGFEVNATRFDSRSPTYELKDNDFMAQLKIMRQMDIHVSGPGTGQMYQTFLSDGSIHINVGGLRPWGLENTNQSYASFLEQHMTSGTPYIKGLYYPINERPKGIQKDHVIKLIRQAGQSILQGFALPVNARENLAPDGQLFVEMCEKDRAFCTLVTQRLPDRSFACLDFWVEDVVHEHRVWSPEGFVDQNRTFICPFNRTILRQLRDKYKIRHHSGG
jgi:hypothetical protein